MINFKWYLVMNPILHHLDKKIYLKENQIKKSQADMIRIMIMMKMMKIVNKYKMINNKIMMTNNKIMKAVMILVLLIK